MASIGHLEIKLDGIGHILADKKLSVPRYQRSYAWDRQNVEELFRDIADAIRQKSNEYFLGSIVTQGSDNDLQIVDGQQRLATTSILLSAIRDYFLRAKDFERASQIEQKFLLSRDLRTQSIDPRLRLNAEDNEFYRKAVLLKPDDPDSRPNAVKESHERILIAKEEAKKFIGNLTATTQKPAELLVDWVDYIEKYSKVIWVRVADDSNAFVIFETLNDRGVELSIADLLKNYLFGKSGDRIEATQTHWNQMVGALETVGGEGVLLNYIRQTWSAENGITREKELFTSIKGKTSSEQSAIDLSLNLAQSAKLYAAMLNPQHDVWKDYDQAARRNAETLVYLRLEQYRPLLLSVLRSFLQKEASSALKYLVSCSVRFLIVGGSGGGTIEKLYCDTAQKVLSGEITTALALANDINKWVPSDSEFESAFAHVRVSKAFLARYYLRALERFEMKEEQPEFVPNQNSDEVNLEHVLPQNPSAEWCQISPELAQTLYSRLGNLVLLQEKINSEIGNSLFEAKKPLLAASNFQLTKDVAASIKWDQAAIEERQKKLAKAAIQVWTLNV
jgi:hypothetical protein